MSLLVSEGCRCALALFDLVTVVDSTAKTLLRRPLNLRALVGMSVSCLRLISLNAKRREVIMIYVTLAANKKLNPNKVSPTQLLLHKYHVPKILSLQLVGFFAKECDNRVFLALEH